MSSSVRWSKENHEDALINLMQTGAVTPNDSASVVFKKFAHLWQGIKESNFAKHFKKVKTAFINCNMNPAVAKPFPDSKTGK